MALSNGQVQEIQRILSERQLEAHRRYLEKREEIFRKLPELEELEEKVRAFSLSVAGEMQQGNREGLLRLKEEIGKLHKEKKALLEGAGYKIQDLEEEEHFCPLCQDTGYVDGKKCQCFLKLQGELLYRQSRMGAVLERENFSKFQLERFDNIEKLGQCGNKTLREYMKEIRDYLTNYCEEYPKNNRSILFTGSTGTGKTYFLHSIAKALLDLAERFGAPTEDGIHVPHDLTQEELAQLVGASRETINKSLAEFVSRGWIRLEGRAVTLIDVERLKRRAR